MHTLGGVPPRHSAHVAYEATRAVVGLGNPVNRCLASTGWGNGRWDGRELEMAEDTRDHRLLGDDGNEPQHALLTPGAAYHLHAKDPLEQARPAPTR